MVGEDSACGYDGNRDDEAEPESPVDELVLLFANLALVAGDVLEFALDEFFLKGALLVFDLPPVDDLIEAQMLEARIATAR